MSLEYPKLMTMSEMMVRLSGQCCAYEDASKAPSGAGTYKLSSGLIYDGEFKNGMFHGVGTLVYPDQGGKVHGTWENGRLLSGKYVFEDGLTYKPKNWQYCTDEDRRFWSEVQNGIHLADIPQMCDKTPPYIPPGCLDIGTGYFNPVDKCMYKYSGEFDYIPTKEERAKALRTCRIGTDELATVQRREALKKEQEAMQAKYIEQAQETMERLERDRLQRLEEMGIVPDTSYDENVQK